MLSHPGRIRQTNEDSCGASLEQGAFVVCDGMGGAAAGEVASQLARDTFLESFAASSSLAPAARLADTVRTVNQAVYRQAQRSRALRGMGTTLVGLACDPASITLVHVGDSRCYRLSGGGLQLLTQDHSLIEEQIQAGLLTAAQAAVSPMRNIITRAIGTYPSVEPDLATLTPRSGDLFLLASDGLTRELDDSTIAGILAAIGTASSNEASQQALDLACHALVDAANAHGGADNITVLLVQIR